MAFLSDLPRPGTPTEFTDEQIAVCSWIFITSHSASYPFPSILRQVEERFDPAFHLPMNN